jgi:hypothetical protein
MRLLAAALAALLLAGCASLKIQDDDHLMTKTTKALLRIPVAVLSSGRSEQVYACDRGSNPTGCRQGLRMAWAEEDERQRQVLAEQ